MSSENDSYMTPSFTSIMPYLCSNPILKLIPCPKPMDWNMKLWLLLIFFFTFCFPLFLAHIPTSFIPSLQNLLFVFKLKTKDCVKENIFCLHVKNVLGTLIEDVLESSNNTDAIKRRLSIPIWVLDQCFLKHVWPHLKV